MIPLTAIPRVSGLTKEAFKEQYLDTSKPVVITDLVDSWPAKEKWTLDFFKENFGHLMVPVFSSKGSQAGKGYMSPDKKMPLKDYISAIQEGATDLRLFLYNIMNDAPELHSDYEVHTIMDGFFKEFPFTFFGGAGSKVAMHYDIDLSHVFLTQFDGRKRVVLFSPEQSKYLYHLPFTVASYIDVDNPDFEKYPALKKVTGYETIIERGDTIFIPSGYWHYIIYLDAGFSMNQRANDSVIKKVQGAVNIATHFVVDKGMNRIFGERWKEIKEEIAEWRANH
ncbi:MAG: cupin-like domain-containing protein [Saprospiraceae bacterium]|nr:cupin-like domain-containing protein [Saprospiraceae bacterium]